jgi:hypothetical protein
MHVHVCLFAAAAASVGQDTVYFLTGTRTCYGVYTKQRASSPLFRHHDAEEMTSRIRRRRSRGDDVPVRMIVGVVVAVYSFLSVLCFDPVSWIVILHQHRPHANDDEVGEE